MLGLKGPLEDALKHLILLHHQYAIYLFKRNLIESVKVLVYLFLKQMTHCFSMSGG